MFADQGASARLTIRANGQVKAKRFPAGFDDSYVEGLEFPVTPGATYTLSVQWEVHQDPDTGGYANLDVQVAAIVAVHGASVPGAGWWSTG